MVYLLLYLVVGCALAQVPEYDTTPFTLAPSSFTCQGRPPGYYADLDSGCRAYHVCDGNSHFTYVCPPRTLFQQRMRICDHSYLVHCEDSFLYDDPTAYYPEDSEELEEPVDLEEPEDSEENRLRQDYYEDVTNSTDIFTTTELTDGTTAIQEPETTTQGESQKFLKFRLKDFRSLFYIPEVDNSVVGQRVKEFVLPYDSQMRFRKKPEVGRTSCPSYCNPRFFQTGSCHPCVMIK